MQSLAADVVVIGAGPAGLAAAIQAKESGLGQVVIIERARELGGLLHQCIHNGFGTMYFKDDLTGPEYAYRFVEKAKDLEIDFHLETTALTISADKKVTTSSNNGLVNLYAKAIVLAMGCRERTRESLLIPGTRPAGILTAGTAQRYINVEGYLPGRNIIILGSGDVGMIMARRLALEGATVQAVVEMLPYVSGLIRNEVQCLHDFSIPLLLKHTITEVHGLDRIEGVTIAKVDKEGRPIAGTEKTTEGDTLLISAGLIPENELSLRAGILLDPLTGGPIVNEQMETNIPGIFAAGNVVHVHDLVDYVSWGAELAGCGAANYAKGKTSIPRRETSIKGMKNIKYVIPQRISGEGEATIYVRVREPQDNVKLQIGNVLSKPLKAVRPGEILRVKLCKKDIEEAETANNELFVSIEGK